MNATLMKSVVMAWALTAAAAANAQLSAIDGTAAPEAIAQAKGLQAQATGSPANPGALPSTYVEAAAPSAVTNQQILAELTRIDVTLRQMLELEQRQFMTSGH